MALGINGLFIKEFVGISVNNVEIYRMGIFLLFERQRINTIINNTIF